MFVLVFGLFSAFSLGVNADDLQLFVARTQDFSWYHVDLHKTYYNNLPELQKDFNGTNPSYKLPALLSSDYHSPLVASQSYITDTYNLLKLSDIGYYSDTLVVNYTNSGDSQSYTVVDRITWKQRLKPDQGDLTYFITDMSNIYINCNLSGVGSDGVFLNLDFTLPLYEQPRLQSGVKYKITAVVSGINAGDWMGYQVDGQDLGAHANFGYSTASVYYTPERDLLLTSLMPYFYVSKDSNLQIQSFTITAVYDNDDVVDAIENQTDDMNKNHDETMEKIDDATDFDDQEQSDLTGAVNGASDQINEKLGILSFGDHVLDQFIGIFDAAAGSPGITLPGFSIEVDGVQHVVWTDQVFDLSTIEDKFGPLMTAVHFATSFLVYAALVMYVQKIFGAIMQDWSDK